MSDEFFLNLFKSVGEISSESSDSSDWEEENLPDLQDLFAVFDLIQRSSSPLRGSRSEASRRKEKEIDRAQTPASSRKKPVVKWCKHLSASSFRRHPRHYLSATPLFPAEINTTEISDL